MRKFGTFGKLRKTIMILEISGLSFDIKIFGIVIFWISEFPTSGLQDSDLHPSVDCHQAPKCRLQISKIFNLKFRVNLFLSVSWVHALMRHIWYGSGPSLSSWDHNCRLCQVDSLMPKVNCLCYSALQLDFRDIAKIYFDFIHYQESRQLKNLQNSPFQPLVSRL